MPVSVFTTVPTLPIVIAEQDNQSKAMEECIDSDFHAGGNSQLSKLFNQEELSDLIRMELNFYKESSEVLANFLVQL